MTNNILYTLDELLVVSHQLFVISHVLTFRATLGI